MARDQRGEREKIIHKYFFNKLDKNQANGLTMPKKIGALDTQTLDVLLSLTEKAIMHHLLKPHHMSTIENLSRPHTHTLT